MDRAETGRSETSRGFGIERGPGRRAEGEPRLARAEAVRKRGEPCPCGGEALDQTDKEGWRRAEVESDKMLGLPKELLLCRWQQVGAAPAGRRDWTLRSARSMWTDGVAGVEGRYGISPVGPCCPCINESKARVEKAECTEIDKKAMVSLEHEKTQRVGVDRRAGQGGRGKRSTKSGAPGAAGEKFVAEEHETPQRRTTVAASERDEEPGRKTGKENEELRNVFVPKGFERMNPGWVTSEGLSLIVELAGVTGWNVAPWWQCLAVMKHDHDGGGADDVKE